jgi:hypothetical protein
VALRARLRRVDIECHAADAAGPQPRRECRFVVDAASGGVDQPHAGLHLLNLRRTYQAAGLVVERCVHGQIVDPRPQGVDGLDRLDAQFAGPVARQERIVPEHIHLERQRPFGDRQPDSAQADDAQSFSRHLSAHVLVSVPLALAEALECRGNIARQGQHQGDRVFGGAERVAARRIHDDGTQRVALETRANVEFKARRRGQHVEAFLGERV